MMITFAIVVIAGVVLLGAIAKIMLEDALFDRANVPWFRKKRVPSPQSSLATQPQEGHSAPKAKACELVNTEKEKEKG